MQPPHPRAALSFTGGKDCHLAWYRLRNELNVVVLVVFKGDSPFYAHPLEWQQQQADALGLPLRVCYISAHNGDYATAYGQALQKLKQEHDISQLITGDIDFVGTSTSNFMTDVCEQYVPELTVRLPLWKQNRLELLREMMSIFDIRLTCVKCPPLNASFLGRRLGENLLNDLLQRKDTFLDLSGENGEYHTMVLHGPLYQYALRLRNVTTKELINQPGQEEQQQWWVYDLDETVLEKCD